MSALLELAERCEAATGPDWELDGEIHRVRGLNLHASQISYTASVDAALSLVLEGSCWRIVGWPKATTTPRYGALVEGARDSFGATPALAICAAALRARAAQ